MFVYTNGSREMEFVVPRPKKENLDQVETPPEKAEEGVLLRVAMKGSQKYQRSQKRYVERLIPIQPITIQVKEVKGKRFEWVPCEKISVEI